MPPLPRSPARLATLAFLAVSVSSLRAPAQTPSFPTMAVADIRPGMKGYGLTVMQGTEPERFDVEVISTLRNFRPGQDLILIKTPGHPRLEAARTVAGMSGSPIYIDGKMIGAYAYGWTFGVEPVAGVTPIASMLDELNRPMPPSTGAPASPRAALDARYDGAIAQYDLRDHAKQVSDRLGISLSLPGSPGTPAQTVRTSTPLLLGGFSPRSIESARPLLESLGFDAVQAGGGSLSPSPSAPTKFVDGGAIAVEMVQGDVSAVGLGTVTHVSGDKLIAFGHPMMNGGLSSLPTAIARVHWILATYNRSFKIGESVRPMGALVNDRQAAIVVDTKAHAPTFPFRIEFEGPAAIPKKSWSATVAFDPIMAPTLVAMTLGSAAEAAVQERRDTTWRIQTEIDLVGHRTLRIADYGAGSGSPLSAEDFVQGQAVRAIGAVLNNPWEAVVIKEIRSSVKVEFGRDIATLEGASLRASSLSPGESAVISLNLQSHRGARVNKVIEVPIPASLAGEELELSLEPGYGVSPPFAAPTNLTELLNQLDDRTYAPDALVATVKPKNNASAAFGRHIAEHLPRAALEMLRPGSSSNAPEVFSGEWRTAIDMNTFIIGKDKLTVNVRSTPKTMP